MGQPRRLSGSKRKADSHCTGQQVCTTGVCTAPQALLFQVDKPNAAAGDTLSATVQLTGGLSVFGVPVSVKTTYQGSVIGTVTATTDISGTANFNIPFGMYQSPRMVSLQAISGEIKSNSIDVLVASPELTINSYELKYFPTANPAIAGDLVASTLNGLATFQDSYGSPVAGQQVRFTLTAPSTQTATLKVNGDFVSPGVDMYLFTDDAGKVSFRLNAEMLSSPDSNGFKTVLRRFKWVEHIAC